MLAVLVSVGPSPVLAQEPRSTAVVKELRALLDQGQLDAVAAKDPDKPDQFVAALYFPGLQLLVVSARYKVPAYLVERLTQKDYKDVYVDLQSASEPDSKVFIDDLGADGLKVKPEEGQPFDSFEAGTRRTAFDGDWKRQKMTEEDYMKAFAAADQKYAAMVAVLVAQLKKPS
jgi:hypothetical protein